MSADRHDLHEAKCDGARLARDERVKLVAFLLASLPPSDREKAIAAAADVVPPTSKTLAYAMVVGERKSGPVQIMVEHADDCACACEALQDAEGPMVFHVDACTCQCNRPLAEAS